MLIQLKMEREIRTFNPTDCEIRATRRGRTIEGYGIVFNSESKDLGGFIEVIDPDAVEGVLERQDVLALLNHDESRGVLARYTNGEGTMELEVDKKGVKYRFEAPDTPLGDEVLSSIRRGDIRSSSFSFSVNKEGQAWEKRSDGTDLRRITKFSGIYDMSPVWREAYADTSVAVRNFVEMRDEKKAKEIADLAEAQRVKPPAEVTDVQKPEEKKDLTDYFKKIDNEIKKMKR
jgi:HK97 family phage prohead protease